MRENVTINSLQLLYTAEFIICLAEKHQTFDEFKAVLVENGAEFTVSVDITIITTLFW